MRIVEVIPMDDIKRGDILFINIPKTTGSVQCGKRYAIVTSNNVGNKYSTTIMIAPTTTKKKHNLPTHMNIMIERESTVLTENILTISKEQIIKKHGHLSNDDMKKLDRCLKIAFGL